MSESAFSSEVATWPPEHGAQRKNRGWQRIALTAPPAMLLGLIAGWLPVGPPEPLSPGIAAARRAQSGLSAQPMTAAQRAQIIAAWQAALSAHPQGPAADEARAMLALLAWAETQERAKPQTAVVDVRIRQLEERRERIARDLAALSTETTTLLASPTRPGTTSAPATPGTTTSLPNQPAPNPPTTAPAVGK